MDNANVPTPMDGGITDRERQRVFVTMNATFKDEAKCRRAMETIVNDAHAAYGVASHFWFQSQDGLSLFVVEQYADEAALRQAVRRFTTARISFFRSIKVVDVSVHGDVSLVIKAMFALLRPTYAKYYAGFSKSVPESDGSGIKDVERNRVFVASHGALLDASGSDAATTRLPAAAHDEPGTSSHFWTQARTGNDLFVLEQYQDETALLNHLRSNADLRAAALSRVDVREVTIYGADPAVVSEFYDARNPTYMNYFGGYSK